MYALKVVGRNETSSYILGNEFHVKQLEAVTSSCPLHEVAGEIISKVENNSQAPFRLNIYPDMDAYITTLDGKTVHVVNRRGWHLKPEQPKSDL